MKKIKTFLNSITIICVISVLFCTCANNQSSRKAIVSGQLTGSIPVEQNRDSTIITLSVPNPILLGGERIEYETTPKGDGTFTVSIPLLCSTYAGISIDYGEDAGYLFVSPGKETKIEVFFNEAGETQIRMIDGKGLTREEIGKMYEVSMDVLPALQDGRNSPDFQLNMPPKAYADSMFIRMERDLSIVKTTTKIPEESKQLLYNTMRLSYLNYFLLDYEEQMRLFYLNLHFGEDVNENDFTPITPDRSYYSFLKDFDLNHPPYFDYVYYPMILESLLDNKVLNIPPIEDLPIKDWMKEVKAIMADLIGADTGLFYDLLAAKTYHKQFTDELKPLSDKQKENIQTYFKNPSFAAILFAENEKILEAVREISKYKKETPAVPKEELMNAI
ncbi:MAG: hypothetical protein LBO74_14310, partial [Candidatus Symbiothrix sp.]|nr:hypothetical protein [Candidatus Symbiothrix sp.]